jgi:hypothetical protein
MKVLIEVTKSYIKCKLRYIQNKKNDDFKRIFYLSVSLTEL